MIEARTLKGFRDRLPAEAVRKTDLVASLGRVFRSFGFNPIETPHLEYAEVLLRHAEDEAAKQTYRFTDQGDREVALRFDLTVPLARFVVQHRHEIAFPFKRYAIGNVFRGEKPQVGRYREFTQCDFDIVGSASAGADAEVLRMVAACAAALGLDDAVIKVNNRKILSGVCEGAGAGDKVAAVLRVVDKRDKVGVAEVRRLLEAECGLSGRAAGEVVDAACGEPGASAAEHLARVRALAPAHPLVAEGVAELDAVFDVLRAAGDGEFVFDPSVVRGLGYYTGTVFETFLGRDPSLGSISSGGRYDGLTRAFADEPLPSVGGSVGIDRVLAALSTREPATRATTADVLVIVRSEESVPAAHRLAGGLRRAGVAVDVYPDPAPVKRQLKYADRLGHPYLLFPDGEGCVLEGRAGGVKETFRSAEEAAEGVAVAVGVGSDSTGRRPTW